MHRRRQLEWGSKGAAVLTPLCSNGLPARCWQYRLHLEFTDRVLTMGDVGHVDGLAHVSRLATR
eukprot:14637702-Alexandrium_andersonii.AAC.1